MKIKYFLMICFVVSIFSCKNKTLRQNVIDSRIDYLSLKETKNPVHQMVDSAKYIKLETTDASVIGKITKLEMYKGRLFLLDRNENLMVFDTTGHFLGKIGAFGRGPVEYLSINNFCIDKKEDLILIIDAGGRKVLYYNFDGNLIKSISSESQFGNLLMNGTLYKNYFFNYYSCSYRTIYSTIIYNKKDLEKQMLLNPYPMNRCQLTFWAKHPFAETKEGITFIKPLSDTLFQFDGNSVVPRFIVEHTLPLATSSICNSYNPEILNNKSYFDFVFYLSDHNYFQGFMEVYETQDYLLLEYITPSRSLARILWNKKTKRGYSHDGLGPIDFDMDKDIYRPLFGPLLSSTDDAFITAYYESDIDGFKFNRNHGYHIDPEMLEILDNWKEGDNPVIGLMYLSQE